MWWLFWGNLKTHAVFTSGYNRSIMRSVEGVDFLTEYAMSREERLVSIRGEYVDNLLFDALLSVADETPLRKMTVSQVAACAGVSRQTFYNHFADINELIS